MDGIPFASPVIKVDTDTGLALLVVRDSSTGKELDQYPSKKAVEDYQRVQGSSATQAAQPAADDGQSLAVDAKAPPAPVPVVTAPSTGAATGSAPSAPSAPSGGSGVKPVGL